MNRSGPKILPWGTPDKTGKGADSDCLIRTCCVLPDK